MNGMIRLTARLAGQITLLLLLPILLIRTQSYDGSGIRTLLMPPEGCSAPCFLGMRPGETTLSAALDFFRQQPPHVHYFLEDSDSAGDIALLQWRDERTTFGGTLHFINRRLTEVSLNGLRVHQIWLALGEPDSAQLVNEMLYLDEQRFLLLPRVHIGYYAANDFRVNIASSCAYFWQQYAFITMGETVVPDEVYPSQSFAQQRQDACEQEREFLRALKGG